MALSQQQPAEALKATRFSVVYAIKDIDLSAIPYRALGAGTGKGPADEDKDKNEETLRNADDDDENEDTDEDEEESEEEPKHHTLIPSQWYIDNLNKYWKPSNTQRVGFFPNFIGGLPPGYSGWSYLTPKGTIVRNLYGHPNGNLFRSVPRFILHVVEILRQTAQGAWQLECRCFERAVEK
ncbi:hypothetical protein AUEXF2481DRAFT_80071 [Aureobasidium subglaciale EXF-2481]|uniref:Cryptic loci regulator 2 N-terminal domain-containing protein n=1 Tax=Aureobasidium subglaciale (strain EXF-2481) TaxID=1043005 RepID=A0A074YLN2_AURSE|nr:uncharacterized protein AUEXF2481DRAFT_80071 [Aureobasidium subglaciale EXF-2481]KAI5211680.1 hypothetical protein E4T38_01179 [Aureobasidium subglaciale]KAI5230286.1 hypothetical protein E4T40_01180 [Aureobasidium subglaciale]KAI5233629.1 hypothetical protein E4T41_01178 [Aureobasidium subglaciale]KAI5266878.1 hypothetical protein E4T46_01178 [Aureobasidium subglaciale]KEQ95017.1 hypothetical protein AUEXF2481DRAFT_80071 [Aureobasidium subglaciale EXF-2481]